ncbi:hypothetical protein B5X24_HaOG210716 [Helicoverpa armigera]|uniref:Uncharacterized protein n=1 Tax=Helicoverpa armigera TaxID=29058 RepID=A0A2W1BBQ7_HELAM|nr:hypothetical protein B5X24_HaOG210716 [Helicoverpa armigera]
MCLSVLAYQEIGRRIEELTGAIYALDPYFVMPAADEPAATLSMLASSARRPRSPERRQRLAVAASAARPRSPCWAPGGVTYAEIVKGSGSRSSSPPLHRDVPVEVDPCVPSDTPVTESISVSEPYGGDVIVYYDEYVSRPEPEPVPEYYAEPPVEYREMPIDVPAPVYRESPEPLGTSPDQPLGEQPVQLVESERAMSPIQKQKSHELSYAEILALGLRKQARTQNVTSLPKPQVAHVELVKEIVVECVERSPPIQQYESKVEKIEPPRFKPDRPDKPGRIERLEKPDRPPPRSRSREMPRQRRAPEKRPTKAHDVQAMKKKKTMKKVIEVQDFDEPEQPVEVELEPIRDTPVVRALVEPTIETGFKEVTKKLQHSATVVETVTEIVAEDSQPENTVEEVEPKKPKKKQKPKKPRSPEDEIQKALKEIEELERNKKKKTRDARDKSKESIAEVITIETPKEPEVIELKKQPVKESDAQNKSKKKKNHKELPVPPSDISTEFITVESTAPIEVVTKETKSKKKKGPKQPSLDKSEHSERSSAGSITDVFSVADSSSTVQTLVDTTSELTSEREVLELLTQSDIIEEPVVSSVDERAEEKVPETSLEVFPKISSSVADNIESKEGFENTLIASQKEVVGNGQTLQEHTPANVEREVISTISVTKTIVTQQTQEIVEATETKEHELLSVQTKIDQEQLNTKASKNKKKSNKNKGKTEANIAEFIVKESEQIQQEQKVHENVQVEQEKPVLEQLDVKFQQFDNTEIEQPEPSELESKDSELVQAEPVQLEWSQLESEETKTTLLPSEPQLESLPMSREQLESNKQDAAQIEHTEFVQKELQPIDQIPLEPKHDTVKSDDSSSKNKKKKKPKKHEKTPEPIPLEAAEVVEIIDEQFKTTVIEPVVTEIPNLVEQVEEQKPQKKKKSKKGKHAEVKEETIESMLVENKEIEKPTEVVESTPKVTAETESTTDVKPSKKKSKSKTKPEGTKELPDQPELPIHESPVEELKVDEPAFEEVKSHKKKKSKKQKIDDNDIEKALKEIERSEGSKKKPKEKTPKPKGKQDQAKVVATESKEETEIQLELTSKTSDYDKSPDDDIENVEPIEHIDWNELLEEEEGAIETTFEPISKPEMDLTSTETAFVANQVTILQEASNLLLEEERTINKLESSTSEVHIEKSTVEKSESDKVEKTVIEEDKKLATPVTSPANEQNNNDKFFSPDVLKEGSYNIVEEITHYEPITQDVETRTIYLITHEEKKLPPIRTVKVFRSKSNSLEEPQSISENVALSEQTITNKITDEKSSINVSDNLLDSKIITEKLIDEEKILSSETKLPETEELEMTPKDNVMKTVEQEIHVEEVKTSVHQPDEESKTTDYVQVHQEKQSTGSEQIEHGLKLEESSITKPEKPLSEEDFSDILEEAIFGSVQDRNRTSTEKRVKEKHSNIPYQELVNEVKSYSENLDTYNLDYDYSQLMISQRDSQNTDMNIEVEHQEYKSDDFVSVEPVKGFDIEEKSPEVGQQGTKDYEIGLDSSVTENPILVPETLAVTEQIPDKLQHELLKTFEIETSTRYDIEQTADFIKVETQKLVDEVDASVPSVKEVIKTDQLSLEAPTDISEVLNKETSPESTNDVTAEPTFISLTNEEKPRVNYQEIKDAEITLASNICTEPEVSDISPDAKTDSSLRVSRTVLTADGSQALDLSVVHTEQVSKEEEVKRVSPVREEAPRLSYHELRDAELIYASQVKPQTELIIGNVESDITDSNVQFIKPDEVKQTEIALITQDTVVSNTSDKTTTIKTVSEHSVDLISAESLVTKSLEHEVADNESLQTSEQYKDGKPQYSFEEIPRQSYHEIFDAERRLALENTRSSLVEPTSTIITEDKLNSITTDVNIEKAQTPKLELVSQVPSISYQEITDAEKLLATTIKTTEAIEEQTKTVVKENILLETLSDGKVKEPSHLIAETPRVSYQEISDAEHLLATIKSKSREASTEPTLAIEEEEKAANIEDVDIISEPITDNVQKMENHISNNESFIGNGDIEGQVIENIPVVDPEPVQAIQPIYEVPRFSYHELNDAEVLLASTRTSVQEIEMPEAADITPASEILSETVETVSSQDQQVAENILEPLRHSYHEIQDAERVLASTKLDEKENNLVEEQKQPANERTPAEVEVAALQFRDELVTSTKTDVEHTTEFISHESVVIESVHQIHEAAEDPTQRAPLEKIELSFEVDDLSNTPISVVYGSTEVETPTLELKVPVFESQNAELVSSVAPDNIENIQMIDATKTDLQISQDEPVSLEEDTFEIIDHSEIKDIISTIQVSETEEIQSNVSENVPQKVELALSASESTTEIGSSQGDITTENVRSITPKSSDDHTIVQGLIEEALQEPETITRTKPVYETFVIDDLNETLVPVVFGDIKDIENSIKYKKQELLLETEPPKSVQSASPEKDVTEEPVIVETSPTPLEDVEIVDTHDDFTIPHPSEFVEGPTVDLGLDAKPETISAEFIQSEVLESVRNLPKSEITQPVMDTHKVTDAKPESLDSRETREIQLTQTETVSRVEKSPIHSLHDLLPEIDSIPEFKPSYSNTVLYSKLSADAPEFTPSYMYQTVTTVSESRSDVVEDAPAPITMEEDTIKVVTEEVPTQQQQQQQISYSSVLQSKKESPEKIPQVTETAEKLTEVEIPAAEVSEEHVENKTKKHKKKKKKEKEDKKDTMEKSVEVKTPTETVPSEQPKPKHESPCPVNVWAKAAEDGKTYADVLAEGLLHDHAEHTQLVSERPTNVEIPQSRPENVPEVAQVVPPAVHAIQDVIETTQSTSSSEQNIGSWAHIVAKRSSPERIHKEEEKHVAPVHIPSKAPMILVDESENDHLKPEVTVDAEGFITVDRSRRSRSKSRDARSQSTASQKRETREKSENRFEALTSTLKPDDGESTQSLSEDEKPSKKPSRKSRSSKSREKDVKPKISVVATSTSDEDKQPPKKDKKKRSSKSKDKDVKPLEEKIDQPKDVEELKPSKVEEEVEEKPATSAVQPEPKKKSKKKKKDKKPSEIADATEPSSPAEITSSEQEAIPIPKVLSKSQKKKVDTPASTPESVQTPIKDRVFSEAQFWKMDPSSLDTSEIISVEIQHTPTESYKIEIKDTDKLTNVQSENIQTVQSSTQLVHEEIPSAETQIQELEDTIAEDQSLESKMADLQREIEEMLSPENDSSLSDDSPKELTDTQTSIEYQYDELLDNMTPSLASPDPEVLESKPIEEQTPEVLLEEKHTEELDDKHISMSMIDSVLDDTEPLSITETHSLEHSENLLVTQEEDITSQDVSKLVPQEVVSASTDKPKVISKEEMEALIKQTIDKQHQITTEVTKITSITKTDTSLDNLTSVPYSDKQENVEPLVEKPDVKEERKDQIATKVTSFIEAEKTSQSPVSKSEVTKKTTLESDVSLKKSAASFILTEQLQELSVPSEVTREEEPQQDNIKPTKQSISEKETADIVTVVPLSNTETITNNLTNLKADNFWTDKHNVHDAEKLLGERNSVERTITHVDIDEPHIDEGISVEENIINDNSFWPEKHLYHDAECQYFLSLARKTKTSTVDTTEIKIDDQNDKDRDQGGSSGHSSEGEEPKDASGSPYDPDYISMDLPGGICSWKDKSSYLSVETPVVDDVVDEPVSREDILTTLPIAPAPSSSKQEPEETPLRTAKVTDPQSYCTIFKYILYVWHDIITKFLISHVAKLCIVMYLATPQLVL